MLIVDDERFEREGVQFLIEKHGLELETFEADSGESALAFMKDQPVDILFSDIRMKGMDGLELAARIRELDIPVKVIFMSAYGEFEYAQRAIDLKAIRYILKPVQVEEFLRVLTQVIKLCEEERQAMAKQIRLEEAYRNETYYTKQKLLSDLILGQTDVRQADVDAFQQAFPMANEGHPLVRLIMLDSRNRFFDRLDQDFERRLADVIDGGFDVAHLNEFQSLLVTQADAAESKEGLIEWGKRLIGWFRETYGGDVSVVVGGTAGDIKQLYNQYQALESMLEYKFFYDEGTVLLANPDAIGASAQTFSADDALEELRQSIGRSRYDQAKARFEQLFNELQNSERFPVVYIKFVCTEIVKAVFDASANKRPETFKLNLDLIYRAAKLSDLRKVVLNILEESAQPSASGSQESMRKVIEDIVRIIESEYGADLSLESLAERVYLSPSYLSHLFKKHKGTSFNKYLTLHRMEKTKELLLTTNRKIVDVGLEVGYANFPYFSSLFKNHYGKTPSQFREEAAP
ncbi:response regulator [Paenibacillus sp. LHD-117]|uniref:response regulator transcription factor n=1 Tax=Paenibacillus sp. LHD-117 TaxID=3071412 RepID=UPI0027E08A61|nr:response regulator [Paenibacillus sp. LHD-117]MDQ6423475.1 response regulator [Paenibacillus sp. LHD-117]